MKFVFAAGGTGGHINPALAVAGEIRKRYPDAEILFIGTKKKMEAKLVPAAGFNFRSIDISGFQRKPTPKNMVENVKTVFRLLKSTRDSRAILREYQPDAVIGFGGYVSGPVLREAAKLGLHTVIHEQNAFPGMANKALAKRVDRVLITVPEAEQYLECKNPPVVTGLPIRAAILRADRAKARGKLGVGNKTVIFSTGGSLGARTINTVMTDLMIALKDRENICFIHGYGQYGGWVPEKLAAHGIAADDRKFDVREYIYDMDECLAAADIVVSRAGASSVAEIEALGRAAILIPSPNVAENHQYHNAMALVNSDAALIVEEKELAAAPDKVQSLVEALLDDPQRVAAIGANARKLALTDAKDKIADIIIDLIDR
ncbi:MAG: undecaprenyldiphospho-muramoylpentapeptide beta-N-acetylglucosaminyltransferase [Clostridia bacterium]|nr:undecaprenyldiphospho-muramoylpentapeptide beta-N-acetylglucosaminyltransferase [Clostridia bacterium]